MLPCHVEWHLYKTANLCDAWMRIINAVRVAVSFPSATAIPRFVPASSKRSSWFSIFVDLRTGHYPLEDWSVLTKLAYFFNAQTAVLLQAQEVEVVG